MTQGSGVDVALSPVPPLRAELVLQEQTQRGGRFLLVKDPVTRRYFRLPARSGVVARHFDGRRDAEAIARAVSTGSAGDSTSTSDDRLSAEDVWRFAEDLRAMGLLDEGLSAEELRARQRAASPERRSLFYLRRALVDPNRVLGALARVLTPIISLPFVFVVAGALALAVTLNVLYADVVGDALVAATQFSGWAWLYGATALTVTLHEMAHGVVARRLGAEVHEMGVMLLYFMPCAYTNVSDSWLVPRKAHRVWIMLAGSVVDLLIWSVAVTLIVVLHPSGTGQALLGALAITTGFRAALLNLNPLIRLDGYYVLSDLLELPNLRRRARAVVLWRLRRWLRRASEPAPEPPRDRRALEIYGWLSSAYVVALLGVSAVLLVLWLLPAAR